MRIMEPDKKTPGAEAGRLKVVSLAAGRGMKSEAVRTAGPFLCLNCHNIEKSQTTTL